MINVLLVNSSGFLSCKAEGHAMFDKKGRDIVCSAATVLLRTAARTLGSRPGIAFEGGAPERGVLFFEARADEVLAKAELKFAADFLKIGFESLSKEFPQNIRFECNLEE